MGLAIETGILADLNEFDEEGAEFYRDQFARIDRILKQHGLSGHIEPEAGDFSFGGVQSFPHSWLHYLRRAYAHRWAGNYLDPVCEGEDPSRDQFVDKLASKLTSHLLCHSDAEGYYLPVDFNEPIFCNDVDEIAGRILGSCHQLRREILTLATDIGLPRDDRPLSTAETYEACHSDDHPFFVERIVAATLLNATSASIEKQTAIVFC